MTKKAENIIVGISIGDLNGIGSEVILKSFEDPRMLELCTPVIFARRCRQPKAQGMRYLFQPAAALRVTV